MPSQKYRVLLMRDDQNVRRFGFNPNWFWAGVVTFLFLLVAASAGAYGVYVLYIENQDLLRQVSGLERELHRKNQELEHLSTIKKFFEANDPEELIALLGNMEDPEQPIPSQEPDISTLTQETDLEKVKVENVNLKEQEDASLRVSFDLSVVKEDELQTGQGELELITHDGRVLDLDNDAEDLRFEIQRFKKIVTTFSKPEDAAMEDVYGLRVTITDQTGDITLQKTLELESILTQ